LTLPAMASWGGPDFQAARREEEDRARFQEAIEFFRQGYYSRAQEVLEAIAADPNSNLASAAQVMLARTLYRQGRIREAAEALESFLRHSPRSRYSSYAHYLLAACRIREHDSFAGASHLLRSLSQADSALFRRALHGLAVLSTQLSGSQWEQLQGEAPDRPTLEALRLAVLEGKLRQGRLSEVIAEAEALQSEAKTERVRVRAAELANIARRAQQGALRVGAILPLTGPLQAEGRSLLRGVQLALKRHLPPGLRVELVVHDSESSMLRAVHAIQELIRDERIVAVIGELEGDKSVAIGAIAGMAQLPVLVPASNTTGLTSVAGTVFQLNMDLAHRGRLLAEFAVRELGCRSFATLAPADEYGMEMADAFSNRVDELGGIVVAQEWYYDSPEDLSNQFKRIRRLGLLYWLADSLARRSSGGSLPTSAQVQAMFQALNDSIRIHAKPGEPTNVVDEEDYPVRGVDAIFFPIHPDDIPYVSSQFARFNIRARPLGGAEWYSPELLQTNRRYLENLVFVTDWFFDEADSTYRRFRDEFRLETGTSPDRWAAYGYDSMSLILRALAEGAVTRQELCQVLQGTEKVPGIRGLTTFKGNDRSNAEINLIQFAGGRLVRIR